MPFPFRADHVGSLLRPADLLAARQTQKRDNAERLRELEDEEQQWAKLQLVTDTARRIWG